MKCIIKNYIISITIWVKGLNSNIQKFGISKIFFKEMRTFIQQGCIKMIKRDSKYKYYTKDLYFKYMLFFILISKSIHMLFHPQIF